MKTILITPDAYSNVGPLTKTILSAERTSIASTSEKWMLNIETQKDGSDRELTELEFKLPNGKTWTGTIQDFMAIFAHTRNAIALLENRHNTLIYEASEDKEEITLLSDVITELNDFLKTIK